MCVAVWASVPLLTRDLFVFGKYFYEIGGRKRRREREEEEKKEGGGTDEGRKDHTSWLGSYTQKKASKTKKRKCANRQVGNSFMLPFF
jgi:hypothetical protein